MTSFFEQLRARSISANSLLCVGLDPVLERMPPELVEKYRPQAPEADEEAAVAACFEEFCVGVIEAVADVAACVKPQAAFFEQYGAAGWRALAAVVRRAREHGLPVILDVKRGAGGGDVAALEPHVRQDNLRRGLKALVVAQQIGGFRGIAVQPFAVVIRHAGRAFVHGEHFVPGAVLAGRACLQRPLLRVAIGPARIEVDAVERCGDDIRQSIVEDLEVDLVLGVRHCSGFPDGRNAARRPKHEERVPIVIIRLCPNGIGWRGHFAFGQRRWMGAEDKSRVIAGRIKAESGTRIVEDHPRTQTF